MKVDVQDSKSSEATRISFPNLCTTLGLGMRLPNLVSFPNLETVFRSGNETTQGMPPSINQRTACQCSELALFWW